MKAFLRQTLATILLGAVILFLLQVTFQTSVVVGSSMEPSFQEGQRLIINKIVYKFREPERGEVIIFHPPNNQPVDYIKRIIGLPGDTIEVKVGKVYVNDSPLTESYTREPPDYTLSPLKVPPNQYFVLGDNRNNSNDSHSGWMLPREGIIGKAWLSIWPPTEWRVVPDYSPP